MPINSISKPSALLLYVLMSLLLSGCEAIFNNIAFYPDKINVPNKDQLPIDIDEFYLKSEDEISIQCLWLPRPGSDKLIIYFHGNAGNVYHRLDTLQILRNIGVNVVGVSYRGYGKSEGSPSESGIFKDGQAVYQHVKKKGFTPGRIMIFGRSIGTTVAVNTAVDQPIAGLILVTPLTTGKAMARKGGFGILSFIAGNSFDNFGKINRIRTPLLIVHGTHDRVIPFEFGKQLYDQAKMPKQFIRIEDANHNDLQSTYGQQYWLGIMSFIRDIWKL